MSDCSVQQPAGLVVGQRVTVLNQKLVSGTFFIEGRAEVMEVLEAEDHRALVKFENDELHGPVERFVDPLAQGTEDDVARYVAFLNEADTTKWQRRDSAHADTAADEPGAPPA